ncbi:hypothetical protein N7449_006573 [Penicillium cf. viridicatum]|uniref:CN hydrolase domain-containing protein n=1 Tax=Penicillium cf. viridicatum TaxID=2972119 RepID=A0A9W9JFN2_9EURO|nr:hypothetical protein N7449_006573 [Penicillium cf. viridicatum]
MGTKYKIAAAHAAPVYMDEEATTNKVVRLIEEAAQESIDLLAFLEAYLPGYPYFVQLFAPVQLFGAIVAYGQERVTADGPEIDPIRAACGNNRVAINLGFSEVRNASRAALHFSILRSSSTAKGPF